MTARSQRYDASVTRRELVSAHLVRLTLSAPGFCSTGILDEWVGLVVPGQFQSRYYTVRSWDDHEDGGELVVDVVVHDRGLVTEWASGDCVGDTPTLTAPQGSFAPPPDAAWLLLVGDLTAMPAIARITAGTDLPTRVWAEVPDDLTGYLADDVDVTWLAPPA
jgi:NADPH-dependent ferric siderophore reductase